MVFTCFLIPKSIECKAGDIHTFTADPETYKVKVYLSIGNVIGKWVQQVFILKKGGDTKISIDDKTLIGPNEP